jgi:hypothetical protein
VEDDRRFALKEEKVHVELIRVQTPEIKQTKPKTGYASRREI